jgi:hypothetical protein
MFLKVYDNKGKTIDRYTILFEDWHFGKSCDALTISENPQSPQGVYSRGEVYQLNDSLGKEIDFNKLPEITKDFVIDVIAEDETKQQLKDKV